MLSFQPVRHPLRMSRTSQTKLNASTSMTTAGPWWTRLPVRNPQPLWAIMMIGKVIGKAQVQIVERHPGKEVNIRIVAITSDPRNGRIKYTNKQKTQTKQKKQ